jgi:anti-sigma factor ChrR (cupin superfamily)
MPFVPYADDNPHPSEEELKACAFGTLDLKTNTFVRFHAASCDSCREAITAVFLARVIHLQLRSSGKELHLTDSALQASAQGELDAEDQRFVSRHLSCCQRCRDLSPGR